MSVISETKSESNASSIMPLTKESSLRKSAMFGRADSEENKEI